MSQSNEQVVHDAVNAILDCAVAPSDSPDELPVQVMQHAHNLLRRNWNSLGQCCTIADLMTATYQLGMSRALASVAAGLHPDPRQQLPDAIPEGHCP